MCPIAAAPQTEARDPKFEVPKTQDSELRTQNFESSPVSHDYFRASAPPTMSMSSLVMTICLVLL